MQRSGPQPTICYLCMTPLIKAYVRGQVLKDHTSAKSVGVENMGLKAVQRKITGWCRRFGWYFVGWRRDSSHSSIHSNQWWFFSAKIHECFSLLACTPRPNITKCHLSTCKCIATTSPELTIPLKANCIDRAFQQLLGLYTNPSPNDRPLRSIAQLQETPRIHSIKKPDVGLGKYREIWQKASWWLEIPLGGRSHQFNLAFYFFPLGPCT